LGDRAFEAQGRWQYRVCPCKEDARRLQALVPAIGAAFLPGDTVISFNWDALLESILWSCGKWSFLDGYGFPIEMHPTRLRKLSRGKRRLGRSKVVILKVHGSINWARHFEGETVGLHHLNLLFAVPIYSSYLAARERDWSHLDFETQLAMVDNGLMSDPDYPYEREEAVVAPTYEKLYDVDKTLTLVWDRAVHAIASASEITVIGYSLPRADAGARALLGYALRQNTRSRVVNIVEPRGLADTEWGEFLRKNGHEGWRVAATFEEWVAGEAARMRR
jgi:hypothetical protein